MHAQGILQSTCAAILHNPSPLAFALVGMGSLLLQHLQSGGLPVNEMASRDVMLCGAALGGITSNLLCAAVGTSPVWGLVYTSAVAQATGLVAYEAWRRENLRKLRAKLNDHARMFLGLSKDYTAEQLKRRWRVLARYTHPDKNKSRHAQQHFELVTHCKEVLLQSLEHGADEAFENPAAEIWGVYQQVVSLWHNFVWAPKDLPPSQSLVYALQTSPTYQ